MQALFRGLVVALVALTLGGCAVMRVTDNLPYGFLDSDDPELVAAALPSYIVTLDGLLVTWPEDDDLLRSGAALYGAYATLLGDDPVRTRRLTARALDYALRAACISREATCGLRAASFPEFEATVKALGKADLPLLYALGSAWAGYIQVHSEDWDAVAELARVQLVFEQLVAVDPQYERGMPQLYLGVIHSLLPPALGGRPDVARAYYEQAIERSGGRNLYAKLMYAKQYARLLYDRDLHDRLLGEVLAADPRERGLTLANVHAQQEARRLLDSADDYF